jgi:hypothetical protein
MTKKKLSRYEINRLVRRVLISHAVDLSQINFTASGAAVCLYGMMLKDPNQAFQPMEIMEMAKDLEKVQDVQYVQFELDNWNIISNMGDWQIMKTK